MCANRMLFEPSLPTWNVQPAGQYALQVLPEIGLPGSIRLAKLHVQHFDPSHAVGQSKMCDRYEMLGICNSMALEGASAGVRHLQRIGCCTLQSACCWQFAGRLLWRPDYLPNALVPQQPATGDNGRCLCASSRLPFVHLMAEACQPWV